MLATSLYALSQALERGEPATFAVVSRSWLRWQQQHVDKWGNDYWCMVQFGILLAVAATGWVLTSAALITLLAPQPVLAPRDFLQHVVLARQGWLFELWVALGAVLAAPIFASSVVTMPLLLDRRIGLRDAVLTSWKAVLANPLPMALWATLIAGLTVLGLGTLLLGLVPLLPLAGPRQLACLPRPGRCVGAARPQCHGRRALMFGYTEQQISAFGLSFGVGAFMLYMLFIIGNLAWEAKAGRFGTFVLFIGLGLGLVGFAAKFVIQWILER